MLLTPNHLHDYQIQGVNHLITNPMNMLWLDPGMGKTVIAETGASHLIKHGAIRAALALAPLRVVQAVWEQEAKKWSHLQHLKFSKVIGSPQQRLRALTRPAHFYLMNYENLAWLLQTLQHYYIERGTLLPFDMLISDEVPKLKNVETQRVTSIIPLLQYFNYRTGLTGTPASNGLEDLFGQFLVIDSGRRLGRNRDVYLSSYFKKEDGNGYKHKVTEEGEKYIYSNVSDITLNLSARDYLDMPDMIVNDIYIDLPKRLRTQYDQIELQAFLELDSGTSLELEHPCSKPTKCLQFSNGAVYTNTETKEWEKVHELKLDALSDIMEETGGEPVLVAYNYQPDAKRILEKFPYARNLTGMKGSEFLQTLEDWKKGNVRMLLGHPASMGHGVDGLQRKGRHLVWFGLNWSLDLFLQFNMRLERQGQSAPSVMCHRILGRDTWDEVVRIALSTKGATQSDLRDAVNVYRQMRGM